MLALLFPFVYTYRRLDLKRRWWHRLFIVAFSMFMLLSGLWIGVLYSETTTLSYSDVDDIAQKLGFGASSSEGIRFEYDPLELRSESPVMAPDKTVRLVPSAQLSTAVDAGGTPVTEMVAPDGVSHAWIPNTEVDDAKNEHGFKAVDTRIRIAIPSVGVVSFPKALAEVQRRQKIEELTRAVRNEKTTAYFKAALYFLLTFLLLSYIVQSLYRMGIYVVFGS